MPFHTDLQGGGETRQFEALLNWFETIIQANADQGQNRTDEFSKICRQTLNTLIWKWTESYGKYAGCQYWSHAALRKFEQKQRTLRRGKPNITPKSICDILQQKKKLGDQRIQHEHVFPRAELIRDHFMGLQGGDDLAQILPRLCVGCVVTHQENANLRNVLGNFENPWMRYQDCGITVHVGGHDVWVNEHMEHSHVELINAAGILHQDYTSPARPISKNFTRRSWRRACPVQPSISCKA